MALWSALGSAQRRVPRCSRSVPVTHEVGTLQPASATLRQGTHCVTSPVVSGASRPDHHEATHEERPGNDPACDLCRDHQRGALTRGHRGHITCETESREDGGAPKAIGGFPRPMRSVGDLDGRLSLTRTTISRGPSTPALERSEQKRPKTVPHRPYPCSAGLYGLLTQRLRKLPQRALFMRDEPRGTLWCPRA